MKSAKSTRQQYGNSDRKSGKRSEKAAKLDRKSSRGMIYENEELRLRTININAEVERGQSDIKRLRRENEHLRREIWTLRDEYDRLNKRFKTKIVEYDHAACSGRGSGGSVRRTSANVVCEGCSNSEDSDSCDTCRGDYDYEDQCSDECCQPTKKQINTETVPRICTAQNELDDAAAASEAQKLHSNFDHLSVVSEETLSNSEMLAVPQNEHLLGYASSDVNGTQSPITPLTPLTPLELVANQLNDLQAVVPPLSYFENILQQHMGSNIGHSPESESTTSNGKAPQHTNGWDYNLESPFTQRKYSSNVPIMSQTNAAKSQFSTFVPATTTTTKSTLANTNQNVNSTNFNASSNAKTPNIETVAITTMPANVTSYQQTTLNSPKHFFAPLKPRLKLNTSLANRTLVPATVPLLPSSPPPPPPPPVTSATMKTTTSATNLAHSATAASIVSPQKRDPPDIYVANGVASPYHQQRQTTMTSHQLAAITATTTTSVSQTDSANLEAILNDIENISVDILAIKTNRSKSGDNLAFSKNSSPTLAIAAENSNKALQSDDKSKKPYRSEMNLLLTYLDGANPTITTAPTKEGNATQTASANEGPQMRRTRSLERSNDSPSPKLPDPMAPFPENRTYIGFDKLNNSVASVNSDQKPPLPPTSMAAVAATTMANRIVGPKPLTPPKPSPPAPPTRIFPTQHTALTRTLQQQQQTAANTSTQSAALQGLSPNKSHLFATIANVAAKRAQFRASPLNLTRSLDVDLRDVNAESDASSLRTPQSEQNIMEAINAAAASADAKRKARRVSILCGDTNSATTNETSTNNSSISPSTATKTTTTTTSSSITALTTTTITNTASALKAPIINPATSFTDLSTAPINPALRSLRESSHSTPNSPHSTRRRSNSYPKNTETTTITAALPPPPHYHTQHQHSQSGNNPAPVHQRHASQESLRGNAADLAAAAALVVARSKCSRRHSDGTVASCAAATHQRNISNASQHQHQHHQRTTPHHHQHQHSTSLMSNNNQQMHRDSTCTSISDRFSNSLPSSRDSSFTNFSMRSQRRKISVGSHTGGKIPWCGCWGNGCL